MVRIQEKKPPPSRTQTYTTHKITEEKKWKLSHNLFCFNKNPSEVKES